MQKVRLSIIVIVMLFIVGCSEEKNPTAGEDEVNMYPFSGIETTEDVTKRPVAVMVSNQTKARPQTGLSKADIVFEMLTEGNITRFMAIYQSEEADVVGPVRSAREYFFDLADNYDAIYVYSGAATFINELINEKAVDHIEGAEYDNDGKLFVREPFRKTPHNSYLQFQGLDDVANELDYDLQLDIAPLTFLEKDAEVVGEAADYIKIDYYGGMPIIEYEYDTSTQKYIRYNDGEPTIELESEKMIAVDNLFIVEADHEVIDEELRRSIDIDSGGKGYLFQRGKVQFVEWENRAGRIVPTKDGEVLPFVPGQTWINFVQTVPEPGVKEQVQFENRK